MTGTAFLESGYYTGTIAGLTFPSPFAGNYPASGTSIARIWPSGVNDASHTMWWPEQQQVGSVGAFSWYTPRAGTY